MQEKKVPDLSLLVVYAEIPETCFISIKIDPYVYL